MNFRVLEKINLSPGKVLEKSWKFVSEKGYEPCCVASVSTGFGSKELLPNPTETLATQARVRTAPKFPTFDNLSSFLFHRRTS